MSTYAASRAVSAFQAGHKWTAEERSPLLADWTFHQWQSQRVAAQMCLASDTRSARRRLRIWETARKVEAALRRGCWRYSSPVGVVGVEGNWRPGEAAATLSGWPVGRPWVWSDRCTLKHTACPGWCRMSWTAAGGRWPEQHGVRDEAGTVGACAPWVPVVRWVCARCRTALHCACGKESA